MIDHFRFFGFEQFCVAAQCLALLGAWPGAELSGGELGNRAVSVAG
ncbi:MAG TPA: hypothetical protein PLT68_04245 [Actinomycetota bacterium]|nr:hypothetical protein [Actinomycetota bacterium]